MFLYVSGQKITNFIGFSDDSLFSSDPTFAFCFIMYQSRKVTGKLSLMMILH